MKDGKSLTLNVNSLNCKSLVTNPLASDWGVNTSVLPSLLSIDIICPFSFRLSNPGKGTNIGLISSLAMYAEVNDHGFIESP